VQPGCWPIFDRWAGATGPSPTARRREVVVVPDRHGTGTNGLLLTPPDAIAPAFGPGSCERHRALALAAGVAFRLERPPSLLLDIDTRRVPLTRAPFSASPNARTSSPSRTAADAERRVSSLSARGLRPIPEVRSGDDLAELIVAALDGEPLRDGQVVAIAHTVVSKAEGAVVALADVDPGPRARRLAAEQSKDPRVLQVVLDESSEILRAERGVLICRTRHGLVCANAGVDVSNAMPGTVVLLPRDPDASARCIRARLRELSDPAAPAVLISDTFGRAWRHGQLDVAIGLAGMQPLEDWRGRTDANGLELTATWLAVADAAAAAADLARSKDSREPVVILDGLERFVTAADGPGAAALMRPSREDLFG
jgi:coenzyme F420-0:L-glutamate ligase/coenzyme F420-1:gamma-L-glutamate ligase